jgi:hypothetical protein
MPTDDSHRIHLAANDPAFPAQREAAFTVISDALTAMLAPLGYVQIGSTWRRETTAGRSAVNLQRSRYGFDAAIPLSAFCEGGEDPGLIRYLDVRDDAACLDRPMSILRTQAMPWLERHHNGENPAISSQPAP